MLDGLVDVCWIGYGGLQALTVMLGDHLKHLAYHSNGLPDAFEHRVQA